MEDDSEEQLIALQLSVDSVCSTVAETADVTYSYDFINSLTMFTLQTVGELSRKLEYYAKHAKRSEINKDDLKLYFRCFPQMVEVLDEGCKDNYQQMLIRKLLEKTYDSHNYFSSELKSIDETSTPEVRMVNERNHGNNLRGKNKNRKRVYSKCSENEKIKPNMQYNTPNRKYPKRNSTRKNEIAKVDDSKGFVGKKSKTDTAQVSRKYLKRSLNNSKGGKVNYSKDFVDGKIIADKQQVNRKYPKRSFDEKNEVVGMNYSKDFVDIKIILDKQEVDRKYPKRSFEEKNKVVGMNYSKDVVDEKIIADKQQVNRKYPKRSCDEKNKVAGINYSKDFVSDKVIPSDKHQVNKKNPKRNLIKKNVFVEVDDSTDFAGGKIMPNEQQMDKENAEINVYRELEAIKMGKKLVIPLINLPLFPKQEVSTVQDIREYDEMHQKGNRRSARFSKNLKENKEKNNKLEASLYRRESTLKSDENFVLYEVKYFESRLTYH